ncbi:MAG: TolC family protein, partial [Candidatus Hydrogenedentes bacterium]|nr:TolC family protein [Candidatus Hydrogenedentota bacterium]
MPFCSLKVVMWPVLVALVLCGGCATIEFSKSPELPVLAVEPPAVEQPSPPPLPPEVPVPAPAPEPAAPAPALSLSIQDAIELAIEKNLGLAVDEIDPASARTLIAEQRALFDPTVDASLTRSKDEADRDFITAVPLEIPSGAGTPAGTITIDERADAGSHTYTTSGDLGVSEFLPTGTTINATVTPARSTVDTFTSRIGAEGSDTTLESTGSELSVTQHVLQGFGLKVNLAGLRQAKLAALSSDYEFRAAVENLVAQVENTYWDYSLAQQQIRILEDSRTLAQNQAKEVEERIRVGVLAETERAAADAEVALRQNLLIDGRSSLEQLRLALLRLLNPDEQALEHQDLALTTQPVMPEINLDAVRQSIAFAGQMRPELNQARLLIQRDDLSLVTTRNGLLPQLDV